jgi:phosphatidylinositol 3-kinase
VLEEGRVNWSETVFFPLKYRDLPAGARVEIKVWDARSILQQVLVGKSTLPLFDEQQSLRRGNQRVLLTRMHNGTVVKEPASLEITSSMRWGYFGKFETLLKSYEHGEMAELDWLDRLTFTRIDEMREVQRAAQFAHGQMEIHIEFPTFSAPVIFHEQSPVASVTSTTPQLDQLIWLVDSEVNMGLENPAERKHQKLTRSVARGVVDHDLKPNGNEKRSLAMAIRLPPTRLLGAEFKALLWKFRFSLRTESGALTKFLKCVDWGDSEEARASVELMYQWAPIDPASALELLSPTFTNNEVRKYAVSVLSNAADDELMCYLLQLVQALRYESEDDSQLARFLVDRAVGNPALANFFHWYLVVEWEDPSFTPRSSHTHQLFEEACRSMGTKGEELWDSLRRQSELMAQLTAITRELNGMRGQPKKVERLRAILSNEGSCGELASFTRPLPLPIDPTSTVSGIVPEESTVFKSALSPLKLAFRTIGDGRANMMFKKGDDLRQDQLCVQMISLMDRLLKRENLDLKLTPYRVLATGSDTGLIEFVPSQAVADILAEHKTLTRYIAMKNPDPEGPYGCSPEALMTFVKSCAGYCVITYILGVGDRHLDNLMLAPDGRMFHIDFGFIMGRDPKIFPPPMKLCKEMVEAMGGTESVYFGKFKTYCCEAYNILRKSVVLILNLFSLMAHANIPDIQDAEKTLLKLESKFALDLDDEAAMQHFQVLINESTNALFPQIFETTHRWAQYWK